jgi:hypothetical protein
MRALFIHADFIEYEARKKTKLAEDVPADKLKNRVEEALVVFISFEKRDEGTAVLIVEHRLEGPAARIFGPGTSLVEYAPCEEVDLTGAEEDLAFRLLTAAVLRSGAQAREMVRLAGDAARVLIGRAEELEREGKGTVLTSIIHNATCGDLTLGDAGLSEWTIEPGPEKPAPDWVEVEDDEDEAPPAATTSSDSTASEPLTLDRLFESVHDMETARSILGPASSEGFFERARDRILSGSLAGLTVLVDDQLPPGTAILARVEFDRLREVARVEGAKTLRQMLALAKQRVEEGRPLVIFPEGTRVEIGTRPPLQAGFAGLYKLLRLPVVPIAVDSGRAYHHVVKRPGRITYKVGETIPAGLPREEVEARVHAAINALNVQG